MSIQLWTDIEALKDRLAKAEAALARAAVIADIAPMIMELKGLGERLIKLERKVK